MNETNCVEKTVTPQMIMDIVAGAAVGVNNKMEIGGYLELFLPFVGALSYVA